MLRSTIASLFIASNVNFILGAYAPDQIVALPGFDGPFPSKQYSGYLTAGNGKTHLHYWYVESELSPATAPTVAWFNGGPGCSSLDGFFYEQGPFELSSDGANLTLREYRWNRIANMLFIEAPVGVGFSYSDDLDYQNNDDRAATENMEAINYFFSLFPELKGNPFYITGESYAGIYVPTLAEAIVEGEASGSYTGAQLKGIAVGNGCTGYEIGICGMYFNDTCQGLWYEYSYLLGLAFIDLKLRDSIDQECNWDACKSPSANSSVLSQTCYDLVDQASKEIGYINVYNVFGTCSMDSCPGPSGNELMGRLGPLHSTRGLTRPTQSRVPASSAAASMATTTTTSNSALELHSGMQTDAILYDDDGFVNGTDWYGPVGCIDSKAATAYLMRADVQAAIHVKDPGYCWAICNQAPGWTYQRRVWL